MKILKIKLPFKLKKTILALGSQTKNTICFAKGDTAYISPVHLDLSNPKDLLSFEKDARYFLKQEPQVIACDLHPEYQSTKFAGSLRAKYRILRTQHHHAHIAACMVENQLKNQNVIGVAFDGTGLGEDNTIWGAEFLICDYQKFSRLAHLKEIPLVGGERAILEPWRVLAAWLNFDKGADKKQVLNKIYKSGINSPLASSMGRLFDAAGSLILGKKEARFEAQLAIELERLADKDNSQEASYKFNLIKTSTGYILDPSGMFKQIKRDLKKNICVEIIARRFHCSVAKMILKTCLAVRSRSKINKVVLSGGVFQNKVLLNLGLDLLYEQGFDVYRHRYLSCADACISLGQAVVASFEG